LANVTFTLQGRCHRDKTADMDDPNPAAWEAAYLAFETPEQETRKFLKRLRGFGAHRWDRRLHVVELFAGRGSGLLAWERLGFVEKEGVDLSARLARRRVAGSRYVVADARSLPFADASRDIVSIQGGLHHLPGLADVATVVAEAHRVLRPQGRLVVVEPWLDLFLRFVHAVCEVPVARRLSPKVEALAVMVELEGETYRRWLGAPREVLRILGERFEPEMQRVGWGKLLFLGRVRPGRPGR
jgi:SAM-dependent methyltransferase